MNYICTYLFITDSQSMESTGWHRIHRAKYLLTLKNSMQFQDKLFCDYGIFGEFIFQDALTIQVQLASHAEAGELEACATILGPTIYFIK